MDALHRLMLRRDIIIVDSDKNLGLVVDDAAAYREKALAELAQTHHEVHLRYSQPLTETKMELRRETRKLLDTLPDWAAKYLERSYSAQPQSGREYCYPQFRLTYKIHKTPVQGRPITGNHCWVTQPAAKLVAELLKPYVNALPTATRDTDQINAELLVPISERVTFLITYDIVRLYPSIPHALCFRLVEEYLEARGCEYAAIVVALMRIILKRNYCAFNDKIWKQHIGFATGIACGAEIANLFIYALTAAVFARFSNMIDYHRRFIDDGFILFTGTLQQAHDLFTALNSLCTDIQLTFDIDRYKAIFLDLKIFKGPGFLLSGVLDTAVYQKPINKYLYTPFMSEHPKHCFTAIVHGEVIRYIKRSSAYCYFAELVQLLKARLRNRGYPASFLNRALTTARRYTDRVRLLTHFARKSVSPSIIFSTTFSAIKLEAGLSRAIFFHTDWLPAHLRDAKFINAWRTGQ
eukprot:SAG11_NODE_2435_length_3365_cov_3.390386_3_plen_464_part_01